MTNKYVPEHSIVRRIWGKADTILVIFAGAAAEFALNKAVDWLYFTGRLPADPLGRLFSTVSYASQIIFSEEAVANASIDKMRAIHSGVETSRGTTIPDEAYRDVLFMLIHYSIAAFELLERKLETPEKEEVVRVFLQVGNRMGIPSLPQDYRSWRTMYREHTQQNLRYSPYTKDLFLQYQKHLGRFRYQILLEVQKLIVSAEVKKLLKFEKPFLIRPLLSTYKISRYIHADRLLKAILLPPQYKERIRQLDRNS